MAQTKQEDWLSEMDDNDLKVWTNADGCQVNDELKVEQDRNATDRDLVDCFREDEKLKHNYLDDNDGYDTDKLAVDPGISGKENIKSFAQMCSIDKRKHIQAMIKMLCQGAPVSHIVSNKCLFNCVHCHNILESWGLLKNHFGRNHKNKVLSLCEANKFITKLLRHVCKICNEDILCDKFFIWRHLKEEHKVTIGQYINKFGFDTTQTNSAHSHNTNNNNKTHFFENQYQIDSLIERPYQDAERTQELSEKCIFNCSECSKTFNGWRRLRSHFSKTHPKQKLPMTEIPKFICKKICHVCKVCSTSLLCDITFITRHVKKHNMSLSQYKIKLGLTTNKSVLEVTYSEKVLGNLCRYKCIDCGNEFITPCTFQRHKKETGHSQNKTAGDSMTKKVCHKCKLCRKYVLCDNAAIQYHMKKYHKIPIEDYCKKTGCVSENSFLQALPISMNYGNLCVYACDICKKKYYSTGSFTAHMFKHKTRFNAPLSKYIVSGFSYQCEKCGKLMLCDEKIIKKHMKNSHDVHKLDNEPYFNDTKRVRYNDLCDAFIKKTPVSSIIWKKPVLPITKTPMNEITSKIGNMCTFSCLTCTGESFPTWHKFKKHCKTVHNSSQAYNPSLISVARCHGCMMCKKVILCDRTFIAQHLSYAHKMSLLKYEKIFRQNGGKTLPSFREWMTGEHDIDINA